MPFAQEPLHIQIRGGDLRTLHPHLVAVHRRIDQDQHPQDQLVPLRCGLRCRVGSGFCAAFALPRCEDAEIRAAEPPDFGYDATAFRSSGATLLRSMVDARERPSCPRMNNVDGNQSCEIGPHRHAIILLRLPDSSSSREMAPADRNSTCSWLLSNFGDSGWLKRDCHEPASGSALKNLVNQWRNEQVSYDRLSHHLTFTKIGQEPTSFTSVGSSADSPAPLLRPSPATDQDAEKLDV
jgi:hypothetical protein